VLVRLGESIRRRGGGYTALEFVIGVLILVNLLGLAGPRYMATRRQAYAAEADYLLQEVKSLEWGYYEEHNGFSDDLTGIGFTMPPRAHWSTPTIVVTSSTVTVAMTGVQAPMTSADQVSIVLSDDGSTVVRSTF
jgi:Tfp pilus assembly protein PilE